MHAPQLTMLLTNRDLDRLGRLRINATPRPDTPAHGECENVAPVMQAQIAATFAKFVGEDFRAVVPDAIGEFFAK